MLSKLKFPEVEGQICAEKVDVLAQKMKERVRNSSYASFAYFKSYIHQKYVWPSVAILKNLQKLLPSLPSLSLLKV